MPDLLLTSELEDSGDEILSLKMQVLYTVKPFG